MRSRPRIGHVEKDSDRLLVEDLCEHSQKFREVWDAATRDFGVINIMETTDRTHFDRGTIYLNHHSVSHDRKAEIAFEITNAYQYQRLHALRLAFPASDRSATDLATDIELVEFEGTLLHSEMMREGIEAAHWPSSMDRFGNVADYAATHSRDAAFAQYLGSQRASGHFHRYVEQALHPSNVRITKVSGSLTDLVREDHF